MPTVHLWDRARDDIANIFSRIATDNIKAALAVYDAIENAIDFLAVNPRAGALCEFQRPGFADCRFWPLKKYTNYLILYRPTSDGIEVFSVIHGAQDMYRIERRL